MLVKSGIPKLVAVPALYRDTMIKKAINVVKNRKIAKMRNVDSLMPVLVKKGAALSAASKFDETSGRSAKNDMLWVLSPQVPIGELEGYPSER